MSEIDESRVQVPTYDPVRRSGKATERFFSKLKKFRAVATRYGKRDDNFLASVQLAFIRIGLHYNKSGT